MINAATVSISYAELKERLGIPAHVSLVAITQDKHDVLARRVSFLFEHDGLPNCLEGAEPMYLSVDEIIEATS